MRVFDSHVKRDGVIGQYMNSICVNRLARRQSFRKSAFSCIRIRIFGSSGFSRFFRCLGINDVVFCEFDNDS